jgi:peptidoglycan/LPS O-acetylase OafA/YrhL
MTTGQVTSGFRADLEGLRGLAILLVLGFHAALPGFNGGFVGVDVFFVLSGFLITGLLIRERETAGAISLRNFYVRRARRILPAAIVVLVVTLVAAIAVASPIDLPRFADDAAASALSVGNMRFALQSMDYFSATVSPSPFLHYWSLGVEEQFYLVWPALLIFTARGARPALAVAGALALVAVLSLLTAVVLTDAAAPWAFYSLPSRAWQLAIGGFLAAVPLQRAGRLIGAVLSVTGWLGLAAVLASGVFLIDASTPYPGTAAILPTLGAAALVAGGTRRGSPGALLATAPLRFLGRISYSLYLVHWPVFLLAAPALAAIGVGYPADGDPLWYAAQLGLCALSVGLAWLSWRFVEQPFHRGRRFMPRPSRVLALAGTVIAAAAIFAVGVGINATYQLDAPVNGSSGNVAGSVSATPPPPADVGDSGPDGTPPPGLVLETPGPDDDGEATPTPGAQVTPGTEATPAAGSSPEPSSVPSQSAAPATPSPQPTPRHVPYPVPDTGALPANVKPALSAAADDWERLFRDGCELQYAGSVPVSGCIYGDPNGDQTVALIGDSTAGQWFPAIDAIARQQHWRLVPMIKFACRFEDIRQYSRILKREYTECEQWLPNVVARLKQIKPDLTLVSADRSPGVFDPADDNPVRQGAAMARLLQDVPGEIGVMVVTPQLTIDPLACLAEHKSDVTACEAPRSPSFGWRYKLAERAAVNALGSRAKIIDLSNWICPGTTCPTVMNGEIVWRDYLHLTATFAGSLAPALAAQLPDIAEP